MLLYPPSSIHHIRHICVSGTLTSINQLLYRKIELITSYYHSDSESNDETESPVKSSIKPKLQTQVLKQPLKKQKTKPTSIEYGPPLPPNQSYTVPIGPELPPNLHSAKPKSPDMKTEIPKDEVSLL